MTRRKAPPIDPTNVATARKIGDAARTSRMAAKLTQVDVAERVNLQSEVYGRLERGAMLPSVATLVRLSNVLGVSSDVLLGLDVEHAAEARGPADDGLTPELRRLQRALYKLDRESLKVFSQVANALLGVGQRRGQHTKDEESAQLGI